MGISPAVILYDANSVAMAVERGVAIPAGTRTLLFAGEGVDGKAYTIQVEEDGKLRVASTPPTPPAGTTEFVLSADSPLEVGPNPTFQEKTSAAIANGETLKLQFVAGGAQGDPSESGSKVEVYWEEGAGPTRHLVERIYLSGATVYVSLPDVSKARDGTVMTGDGTNTKLVIRRERLSNSAQEIDAVVRGYTES